MPKTEEQKKKVMFNEVADAEIRANNRAAMMANLYEAFGDGKQNTSQTGLLRIMEYFQEIPKEERALALEYFNAHLENRGIGRLQQ